ncbi:hypothetical protein PC9H_010267 [Pleurotus ostreatus]|uniref:Uncharacterized protein n=1 Tax=Pleurotus ostreatus TaxID=5322 RepID=A0A8H6ZSS7_PLEOS|nr:uncharacterized protein PC9H_010267 [Pleurotus ostreatus]KAF7424956.1 hypothetical protein PC9H_010267 [Pleurotus ostreatus]
MPPLSPLCHFLVLRPHSKAHMMSNLEDEDLAPDATLLAVIGVLDAARDETSVVARIHGGGLWVDDGTHKNEAAKDASPDAASAALSGVAPEDTKSTSGSEDGILQCWLDNVDQVGHIKLVSSRRRSRRLNSITDMP